MTFPILLLILLTASSEIRAEPPANTPDLPGLTCCLESLDGVLVPGGYLYVSGWAADPKQGSPVPRVVATLDGKLFVDLERGVPREDVGVAFGRPDYSAAGFWGMIPLDRYREGRSQLQILAISADGTHAGCEVREIDISKNPAPRATAIWPQAMRIALGAWAAIAILGMAGWVIGYGLEPAFRLVSAPVFGLCILGLSAEAGHVFGFRPLLSFVLGGTLLALSGRFLRGRLSRPPRFVAFAPALVVSILLTLIGVIPMASFGPDVVMGHIDDAVRECIRADAILFTAARPSHDCYASIVPRLLDASGLRFGSSYLLAIFAEARGSRAFAVHSTAMLASGILSVLGAFLLARRLFPGRAALVWLSVALVGLNSILYTNLYGQHLGGLLDVPLLTLFVVLLLGTLRTGRRQRAVLAAVVLAAHWTFYPESTPLWALSAILVLFVRRTGLRLRNAALTLVLVGAASLALNPAGSLRATTYLLHTTQDLAKMRLRYQGDTAYFPSIGTATGIERYRLDAPSTLRPWLRATTTATLVALAASAAAGLLVARKLQRRLAFVLLTPLAAALLANRLIDFPYGYAKFLPVAAIFIPILLVYIVNILREEALLRTGRAVTALAFGALACLVLAHSGLSARHVCLRALQVVPAFDAAYSELPDLVRQLPPDSVLRVGTPLRPNHEWMRYMLWLNRVEGPRDVPSGRGRPRFAVEDLRSGTRNGDPVASTKTWAAFSIADPAVRSGP